MKHRLSSTQTGFAVLELIGVIVVIAIIGFAGWFVVHAKHNADTSLNNSNNVAKTTSNPSAANGKSSTSASTTNGALNSDLGSINSSQTQESQDATTANNGINDQSSEVVIPTN